MLPLDYSINQELQIVFPNDSLRCDIAINSVPDWTKVTLPTENQLIFCHEIEKKIYETHKEVLYSFNEALILFFILIFYFFAGRWDLISSWTLAMVESVE